MRYDLLSPRKDREDKTRWHKVGAAFPRDKGGFQLVFDSLPLPDAEGRVTLMMWEAKPRDDAPRSGGYSQPERGQAQGYGQSARAGSAPAFDDEIPF